MATLNGRAYYTITSILKTLRIPYESIEPGSKPPGGVKLVITTREEKPRIPHTSVAAIEELGQEPIVVKANLYRILHGASGPLVVGLDPGERIGVAIYLGGLELETFTATTPEGVVARLVRLLAALPCSSGVVRIGAGDLRMAEALARDLARRLGPAVMIELVDERGTSNTRPGGRGGERDQHSARLIALRQGRPYNQG